MTEFVDHALKYARAGFPVFPLQPRSKVPATAHGKDDATTDQEQIVRWWTNRPDCNIAIRPPEGVVVIDVDLQNGGGVDQLGILPPTLAAQTGNGGYHLYYAYSGPVRGKVAGTTGIDVKTHTGYLVAAPSIHPNGNRYRWINKGVVTPLPPHLRNRVARPQPRKLTGVVAQDMAGVIRVLTDGGSGITQGDRNSRLFWAACRFVEKGADTTVLEAVGNSIGLDPGEVVRTIASAQRRAVSA